MARLRRADSSSPGLARRGRGRGFEYLDEAGKRVTDPDVLDRIRALVIPPAWTDVWICPYPTATSRPSAPTQPGAASTSTTPTGAGGATWKSSFGEPATQGAVEEAVLDLLERDLGSPALERVA